MSSSLSDKLTAKIPIKYIRIIIMCSNIIYIIKQQGHPLWKEYGCYSTSTRHGYTYCCISRSFGYLQFIPFLHTQVCSNDGHNFLQSRLALDPLLLTSFPHDQ
eukprot:1122117-Ditylum_brightwellii.AAC.1